MQPRSTILGAAALTALASLNGCDKPQTLPKPQPETKTDGPQQSLPPDKPKNEGPLASQEADKPEVTLVPALRPPLPKAAAEVAPPPSERVAEVKEEDLLRKKIESHFQDPSHQGRRIHMLTDKPLYKPGETLWIGLWDLKARSLSGDHGSPGLLIELVSPRGAVVQKKRIREQSGRSQVDFPLGEGIPGGEYTLRVRTLDRAAAMAERPVIVASYEAPRLQLKMEFLRKAYGAGDEVAATIAVRRPTGEPLKNQELSGLIRLDGQDLPRVSLRTNEMGEGVVRFQLPERIETGDGLLTMLAEDGGLTESIQKRIPIIVNRLQFAAYPEGGQLIESVPGRVYFEAKNPLGKPADVMGRVVDDQGQVATEFGSVRDGLGRFDLTPAPGRTYHIEIDKPQGVTEHYPVPLPLVSGCTLRSFDDLDGQMDALRVAVRCDRPRRVLVSASLRENLLDAAAVEVPKGEAAIVYLTAQGNSAALAKAQGVARVTVFDEVLNPLAERLVYRNRRARLDIQIEPERSMYSPREQVKLAISTKDPSGQPVSADVGLTVVDDTVLTYADDKTGHILSKIYLEPELPQKVEEPNFYFDLSEEKSGLALDLLMGTKGFRRFEWQKVFVAERQQKASTRTPTQEPVTGFGGLAKKKPATKPLEIAAAKPQDELALNEQTPKPEAEPAKHEEKRAEAQMRPEAPAPDKAKAKDARPLAQAAIATPAPVAPPVMAVNKPAKPMPPAEPMAGAPQREMERRKADKEVADPAPRQPALGKLGAKGGEGFGLRGQGAGGAGRGEVLDLAAGDARMRPAGRAALARDDMDGLFEDNGIRGGLVRGPMRIAPARPRPPEWATVRVFPVPSHTPDYAGPRTDFRETIFFQSQVRTDQSGKATVTFPLSDAITSFRVQAEGVGAGAAGRSESVVKSSLPFSMALKVPLEVSEGDRIEMPLVLTNERDRALGVDLTASFGNLLQLERPVTRTQGTLAAGSREALFYPLVVTGKKGKSELRFTASASGLKDEFVREIVVTPKGFPQHYAKSGTVRDRAAYDLDLGVMLAGTADGTLRLYPSPVASMISGLEGMLHEPSGCFEQASSTNYPNVMIMRYLRQHKHVDAALMARTNGLLDSGYKKLVGYETPVKGYEWFGAAPGHEALTAYGLLQFTDMKEVYPEVEKSMLARTAAWLRSKRDGHGGYHQDSKALDSFGRASKEVTNAYITYALTEAKQSGMEEELAVTERLAQQSSDAYLLALAVNSLFNASRRDAGQNGATRLVSLQDESGGFLKAGHSITRSGGTSLHVETTALAVLGLLKAQGQDEPVRKGVEWLIGRRGGYGQFGSTQATVLALKALTAYAIAARRMQSPGDVTLQVNGKSIGKEHYEAGRRAPIVFADFEKHLKPGQNRVEIIHEGQTPLPFSLGLDYRALKPATSPSAPVELKTALDRKEVNLGESVRLNVAVKNRGESGQPMTLVRVGIPGGLTFQTWQLKELRDKGLIAFYETGPREVNLYLRQMQPRQEVVLPLDLIAKVPGRYLGPASRAYLYYTSEHKSWVDGVEVTIRP